MLAITLQLLVILLYHILLLCITLPTSDHIDSIDHNRLPKLWALFQLPKYYFQTDSLAHCIDRVDGDHPQKTRKRTIRGIDVAADLVQSSTQTGHPSGYGVGQLIVISGQICQTALQQVKHLNYLPISFITTTSTSLSH